MQTVTQTVTEDINLYDFSLQITNAHIIMAIVLLCKISNPYDAECRKDEQNGNIR